MPAPLLDLLVVLILKAIENPATASWIVFAFMVFLAITTMSVTAAGLAVAAGIVAMVFTIRAGAEL